MEKYHKFALVLVSLILLSSLVNPAQVVATDINQINDSNFSTEIPSGTKLISSKNVVRETDVDEIRLLAQDQSGTKGPLPVRLGWTADGEMSSNFGEVVKGIGDVNGDGYPDVLVSAEYFTNGEVMEGKVYAYYGTATGISATPSWTAEGNQPSEYFGSYTSGAGDINGDGFDDVIIGNPYHDTHLTDAGKVMVYFGSATGLSAEPAWSFVGEQAYTGFGKAISGAGDINGDGYDDIILGAPSYIYTWAGEGKVYVFYGSAAGLPAEPTLSIRGIEGTYFGLAVSGGGDLNGDGFDDVLIGAAKCTANEILKGCVFAYHGSASGFSEANWMKQGAKENSGFGEYLSIVGDVNGDDYDDILLGAPNYTYGEIQKGNIVAYFGSPSGLEAFPSWNIEGDQRDSQLGKAVSGAGDLNGDGYDDVMIGAPSYDNGNYLDEGRVFSYYGSSSGLSLEPVWINEVNQSSVYLGVSVSAIGDVNSDGYDDVIVGAPSYSSTSEDIGRALVYYGAEIAPLPQWTNTQNQAYAEYGKDAKSAGDVNGDGYADVIIGAPNYDNGQENEGRVFVFYGSETGISKTPDWIEENDYAGSWFGYSVGTAGDVNNDGYDDVIIGAPGYWEARGMVYVYLGSSAGLATEPIWSRNYTQTSSSFGYSVGTAGDVNNDGYDDIIIGASEYDSGIINRGQAEIYYGTSTGVSTDPAWTATSDQQSSGFGSSVGTAGDINGDGYDDVLVGASAYDNGNTDEGVVLCYYGSETGPSTSPSWSAEGNQDHARFGFATGTAGDVNGDGFDDVIIGAYQFDGDLTYEGKVFIFHGSAQGLSESPNWTQEGDQQSANFGHAVATAGDTNGDGFDDILIGAIAFDNGQSDEGRAYLYLGSDTGLHDIPSWTPEGNQNTGHYGYSVASAGDINADGYSDLIFGSPDFDLNQINEGKTDVFYMAKPVSDANIDQDVALSADVTLNGSGSFNPFGNIYLAYAWQQISGPTMALSDATAINPRFTAPNTPSVLVFSLVVTNLQGISSEIDEVTIFVASTPPISDAGPDQGVPTNTTVSLNGEGSFDPFDNYPITYTWAQIGGTSVILDDPSSSTPTFTTPSTLGDLTFSLTVTNNLGLSDLTPDEVVIHVTNPPVSDAGTDQSVYTQTEVVLDGSGSFDPDGDDPLTYLWTQVSGETVSLSDPTLANPTFTAPPNPASFTFSLTVTDSLGCIDTDGDQVVITVNNQAPVSHAGPDQSVETLVLVTLDGTQSMDPDDDLPLTFSWVQTSGISVTLNDSTIVSPTFNAPADPTVIKFSLVIWDSLGLIDATPDEVIITVNNQEPVSNAGADQSENTLALVTLDGSESFDPDGDEPLEYYWTQIAGLSVELSSPTAVNPTFIAPLDPGEIEFSLVVTDNLGLADTTPDNVVITILNQAPIANAGPDLLVDLGTLVTLDGSGSFDPDEDYPLTYLWLQTGGPTVELSSTTIANPTFLAPNEITTLSFILYVTDHLGLVDVTADQVVITVAEGYHVFLPILIK